MKPDPNPQPAAVTAAAADDAPPDKPPLRSVAALSRFLLVTVAGLAVDLWTKVWAFNVLVFDQTRVGDVVRVESRTFEFIPGWLHFHCTANQGAVFGIGQGNRWLFVLVSAAAIAFLTYLFSTSGRQRFYQVVLGMLLAGVLGNMYDRVVYGYVRDMIYVLPHKHWPGWVRNTGWDWAQGQVFPWIFNVADSLLCTGVALMLVYSLFVPQKTAPADPSAELEPVES